MEYFEQFEITIKAFNELLDKLEGVETKLSDKNAETIDYELIKTFDKIKSILIEHLWLID